MDYKNKMVMHQHKLGILLLILIIFIGCEKEDLEYISIDCILVDEFGDQTNEFSIDDSLIFEFYVSNFSGEVVTYLRPCGEFGDYLNIFRETSSNTYSFYGRPVYYCPAIAIWDSIYDGEKRLVSRIPWVNGFEWPDKEPGNYYVGDTLSLNVKGDLLKTFKRIYFEIL